MPDPIEARMNFIIEQQAQFVAGMQLLKKAQARTQRKLHELAKAILSLTRRANRPGLHAHERKPSSPKLGRFVDRRLREISVAGTRSDRRMAALMDRVDKLVRRNGG